MELPMDSLSLAPALLPDEAPLSMPVRSLLTAPEAKVAAHDAQGLALRRALVLGGALLLTLGGAMEMSVVVGLARWTVVGLLLTIIFAGLFFFIALAFTSGLAGFIAIWRGDRGGAPAGPPRSRTALLMPVFHETVPAFAARLSAMRAELVPQAAHFDIFVLSDSREPGCVAEERDAMRRLTALPGPALFYRHRTSNAGRKAGNIAEWVRRFGGAYEQFLILDADSVMSAETLLALVSEMEAGPRLGLLQTLPCLIGGATLFARLQQFASHVYGPMIAHGLAWWHGPQGNYWGHNAMIRTHAFADACGLPELRGRKPFGGEVMSHDFVEAALLIRAGWEVRMRPGLSGSFEQGPPNLAEMAKRDRRWCQGNLQHAAILGVPGLHPLSRLHMLTGIAAYTSAPLWLGFLLLGIAVSVQARFLRPEYFPTTHALFPQWPVVESERALWLFAGTLGLLLAPKILSVVAFAASSGAVRSVAGLSRLLLSALFEILVSALLSPVAMLTQSGQVLTVLLGRDAGWAAQRREDGQLGLAVGLALAWQHVLVGLVLAGLALAVAPRLAAWMAPVLIGLVLAPLLISWTASARAGAWVAKRGLLRPLQPPD
jgi:membrane glycosyltransferase